MIVPPIIYLVLALAPATILVLKNPTLLKNDRPIYHRRLQSRYRFR